MQPEDERDAGYLWDMREAVRDCIDFVKDATYAQFSENEMMHSAVERRLEILGEVASRVSDSSQANHPDIPWKEIKGLRLVLAATKVICDTWINSFSVQPLWFSVSQW